MDVTVKAPLGYKNTVAISKSHDSVWSLIGETHKLGTSLQSGG